MDKIEDPDPDLDSSSETIPFTSEKRTERPGFMKRLLEIINPPPKTNEPDPQILKRIHAHKEDARKVKGELAAIKRELASEDPEFAAMVLEVIDPMLRSIDKIKGIDPKEGNSTDLIFQMQNWSESAKLWVELLSKTKDVEKIKAAIGKHIIDKSIHRIEKDIRFIKEYYRQHLEHMRGSPEKKEWYKQKKGAAINKYLEKLKALMQPPKSKTFEQINLWRQELDEQRGNYLDAALQEVESDLSLDQ